MSYKLAALALAALLGAPASALAVPRFDDPFRGLHVHGNEDGGIPGMSILSPPGYSVTYSANQDRLRIQSLVQAADFTPYDDEGPYFTSRLDIEAGIDALGNVVDSGYLIWYGDFGSGSQVLATAHLLDIGFYEFAYSEFESQVEYAFLSIRLLFDIDYLSPLVPGRSPLLGLWIEQSLKSPYESPFFEDWTCLSSGDGTRCIEPWSTSSFVGLTVAQPAAGTLWGLALACLFLLHRKRSLLS